VRSLLHKLPASLLIALIALPFTAPFSMCDLSTLLGTHDSGIAAWSSPDTPSASVGVGVAPATGSVLEEEPAKDALPVMRVVRFSARTRAASMPSSVVWADGLQPTLFALRL